MPVQDILTRRLNLRSPRFELESVGAKVSGSVISPSFRGMRDSERQRRIWEALHDEYGPESVYQVGTLLAFTPEEWDLDTEPDDLQPAEKARHFEPRNVPPDWERVTTAKQASGKRTLIKPMGDARYVRRDAKGRIVESDDVGRSLAADRRKKAKTAVKTGLGNKGDRKPKGEKKGANR